MMKLIPSLVLAAVSTVTVFGQGPKDPTIDKLMTELIAAMNKRDGSALEAFYADDAVMMPPDAPIVRGKAAIRAHYEREWKAGTLSTDDASWS